MDAKRDEEVIVSRSPVTGDVIGETQIVSPAEVRQAVDRARHAQRAWGALPVRERCERLSSYRDGLVRHSDQIVELMALESGKPRQESLTHELLVLVDLTTWYINHGPSILAPRNLSLHLLKHRRGRVRYEPRGVVGIISPWNFPLVIPFGDAMAALVAGSAVVLKPSEVTPLIALLAKRIWDESGLNEDLLQVIPGNGATGAALIDSGVDKIVFTGGVDNGRRVAAACGERLTECVLELGGKAPAIVREDADIELAARAITWGGFANLGQACIAVERVLAHERAYEPLVERVVELTQKLRQGDPRQDDVDVGAITFSRQIQVAEDLIRDAIDHGAQLRVGGRRFEGLAQSFQPTILSECSPNMRVMQEEIFGPIVAFMRVGNDDRAVEVANSLPIGLNAYIFSSNVRAAEQLAARLEFGSVVINDAWTDYGTPEAPFGGVKSSGWGRIHGEEGLRAMARLKHVASDRVAVRDSPFWFPYSEKRFNQIKKSMELFFSSNGTLKRLSRFF